MASVKLEINDDEIKRKFLFLGDEEDPKEIILPKEQNVKKNLLKPDIGFCIKTKDTCGEKAFINVCTSDGISSASMSNDDFFLSIISSHQEFDKSGCHAVAYDVIINEEFIKTALKNKLLKKEIIQKLLHKLEKHFSISLDKKDWIILKNKNYFGQFNEQFGIASNSNVVKKNPMAELNQTVNSLFVQPNTDSLIMREVSSRKITTDDASCSNKKVDSIVKRNISPIQITERTNENELESLLPNKRTKGNPITIKPNPGICIKTKDMQSNNKIFINVCTSNEIPEPEDITDNELIEILESDEPSNFRVPMSIGDGHGEVDKSGNPCLVYDVIIHSNFFIKILDNVLFINFFILASIEGLNEKFDLKLNENEWHIVKNKKYYGSIGNQTVRTEIPLVQELSDIRHWDTKPNQICETKKSSENSKFQPEYSMHEVQNTLNKEILLKAVIKLPQYESSKDISLKMSEDSIILDSSLYFLHIGIPYRINTKQTHTAYFVNSSKELVIHLSIKDC